MTHTIPSAALAWLPPVDIDTDPPLIDDNGEPWHPLAVLMNDWNELNPPGSSVRLRLPQSFATLSRILARHVGLPPDGDNVPRWTWCPAGAWTLKVGAGDMPHTMRRWSKRPQGAARFAPVEDGSPQVGRDRAVVAAEGRRSFAGVFVWEARVARAVDAVAAESGKPREKDVREWTEEDVAVLEKKFWMEPWTVELVP